MKAKTAHNTNATAPPITPKSNAEVGSVVALLWSASVADEDEGATSPIGTDDLLLGSRATTSTLLLMLSTFWPRAADKLAGVARFRRLTASSAAAALSISTMAVIRTLAEVMLSDTWSTGVPRSPANLAAKVSRAAASNASTVPPTTTSATSIV